MQFAISTTFTRSLEKLEKSLQSLVKQTVYDFQVTPEAPGGRLHRVTASKEKDFWSLRVNDDLRIILHKRGDLFTFCYVDHHDEAYAWAERRRFTVHPQTGAAQIVEVVERVEEVVRQVVKEGEPALFAAYDPDYLSALGVPAEWLDAVRAVGDSGFWQLKDHLPEEAFERLLALATGEPVPRPEPAPEGADPLQHPDAQRRFRVVDNQDELRRAMEFPWERWMIFLHPSQRKEVEKKRNGPALVSGTAGTGKTVVALHRAAHLLRKNPSARVLLTTYSRTLAARLAHSADLLLGATSKERERLQIKHLHALAKDLFTRYTGKPFLALTDKELQKLLEEGNRASTAGLTVPFLRAEWDAILDPRGITTWEAYKKTSRAGRGTPLSLKQRLGAWKVFEYVLKSASARGRMTWQRLCLEVAKDIAREKEKPFDHIIADECQDFGPAELTLLRALVSPGADDIFLTGDVGQRIYKTPFSWSSVGLEVRGRSSRLKLNYRTTEQIRGFAENLIPEVMEGADGTKEERAAISLLDGPHPEVLGFAKAEEEGRGLEQWIKNLLEEGYQPRDIAIFCRVEDILKERAEPVLRRLGLRGGYLSDDAPPSPKEVALGTMHRAKGLEFRAVAVVGCEERLLPLSYVLREQADEQDRQVFLAQERQLLYVACTRARERLLLTYSGAPSPFLRPTPPPERLPASRASAQLSLELPSLHGEGREAKRSEENKAEPLAEVIPFPTQPEPPAPEPLPSPRFRLSPSTIARYFFHDCERFLRFRATPNERRGAEGIPPRDQDRSPLMEAIFENGFLWEEEVITTYLKDRVAISGGQGALHTRRFGIKETIERLRREPAGRYIYQATVRPPRRFYDSLGIDPALVQFADNYPDLIAVEADREGRRLLRVIDLKRGASLRYTYRVQILLYAMQLQSILEEEGISDARVELEEGAIWLGRKPEPTRCDLRGLRPSLEQFLRHDLPRVLAAEAGEAAWHLYFRCEWCGYFRSCWQEMVARDDLSQLSRLTPYGKRFLVREQKVRDLTQLGEFLEKGEAADAELSRCASLAGKRPELVKKREAFVRRAPQRYGASSAALPRFTPKEISIYLTLQDEPLGDRVYLAGFFVSPTGPASNRVFGASGQPGPEVWVASAPEECGAVRRNFIRALHDVLQEVHEDNASRPSAARLSLQVYTYSEQERTLLIEYLLGALSDPELSDPAMALLLHFQGPDLLLADEHPDRPAPYPVVVLLDAMGQLLALPVEVSYTLPEALEVLKSTFRYRRNNLYHFPLGHGFKADAIHAAWYRGEKDKAPELLRLGQRYLYAQRALLSALRGVVREELFVYPPPFSLHPPTGIKDRLLSRMAFFARYESLLRCREIREKRAESREVQRLVGTAIELVAHSPNRMEVAGEQAVEIESSPVTLWLLARDTEEGRRAQLQYPDYQRARSPFRSRPHPDLALVKIEAVEQDGLGLARNLTLSYGRAFSSAPPRPGERFVLYPVFTDYTTHRVVAFLEHLDRTGGGLFLDLLRDPEKAAVELPLPDAVEARAKAEEEGLSLTPSQREAYRAVRRDRVVAVMGPPGTGKTHFLASVILGLASAHAQNGKPFRVLVTAFTHAAIENVLKKLSVLQKERKSAPVLRLGKAKGWQGEAFGEEVADDTLPVWLADGPHAVLGATVYSCLKVHEHLEGFDLVVVDEASQVAVPAAAIPASLLGERGRLLLAGDHLQLPPIVAGEYPKPKEGEPVLHRSVFHAIQTAGSTGKKLVRQLEENFRMNDVLTGFAARLIYGERYRCVDEETARARLPFTPSPELPPWVAACLSPEYPLVLGVLDGIPAGKETPQEAELVAELVLALRDGLRDREGNLYTDDAAFFRKGLFVVSPHHTQIRLIRRALQQKRPEGWGHPPFVDTVDKMQGQEAEAVIVSYGVSDPEFAMKEAAFIYGRSRLNVAMTRAKTKTVIFLPRALLEARPQILEIPEAEEGLTFMQSILAAVERQGESFSFSLSGSARLTIMRTDRADPTGMQETPGS